MCHEEEDAPQPLLDQVLSSKMMNTSPQQNTEQIQSTTATFDKQHGMTVETVMPKVAEKDNMNLVEKKLETNQETVTTRR